MAGLAGDLSPTIASHSTVQDFYVGSDFLMRREDYTLDIAGGQNVANYALDVLSFDGLYIPAKRRAYLCNESYRVLYDRLLIWIDFSDVHFT